MVITHNFFLLLYVDECQTKYGNANAWRYCCKVFDLLTIAAVSFHHFFYFIKTWPISSKIVYQYMLSSVINCVSVHNFDIFFQIIDDQVLCVHGGLSPLIRTLDQIRTIKRNQEIPHKGAFCDILFLNDSLISFVGCKLAHFFFFF